MYLEADDKMDKARRQSAGPHKRGKSLTPKWGPPLAKEPVNRYKEAHADDGTDDTTSCTRRRHVEARNRARQTIKDQARKERDTY